MSNYYAYRIFLDDNNMKGRTSVFHNKKEDFFINECFNFLEKKQKASVNYRGEVFILHKEKLNDHLYLWQITKSKEYKKPVLKDNKIEEVSDTQYPYVYVILSTKYQVALIQHDSLVFTEVKTTSTRLESYFNQRLGTYGINARLNEISDYAEIEYEIELYDSIQKIDLYFDPPNFFRGSRKIDEFVKDFHGATMFENLKISLSNNINGLELQRKQTAEYLGRLAAGAGRYIIKGIRDKFEYIIDSAKFQLKIRLKSPDELETKELEEKVKDISEINEKIDNE